MYVQRKVNIFTCLRVAESKIYLRNTKVKILRLLSM